VSSERGIAVLAALTGNLLIAALKLVAGLVANSAAMLAEAAHSFSDVGNQVLLFIGLKKSSGGPTEQHPFGTHKSQYFWSFLVAILLFGVAGAYSLLEGIEKALHPRPLDDIRLALGVLAVAFVIEAASLAVALRQSRKAAKKRGPPTTRRQFLRENRDATLLTVIVEDTMALIGLPIAAAAMLLTTYTGNPVWDGVGSALIGALLMGFAVFLGKEVHDLLLGRGLAPRDLAKVHAVLRADPAVEGVLSLQTMHLGPEAVLLGAELDLRDHMAGPDIEAALLRLERALIEAVPSLKYVYLEPRNLGVVAARPPRAAHESRT